MFTTFSLISSIYSDNLLFLEFEKKLFWIAWNFTYLKHDSHNMHCKTVNIKQTFIKSISITIDLKHDNENKQYRKRKDNEVTVYAKYGWA